MTDTILEPPPERDLPPGRHRTMRDEILRGVATDRRRPAWQPRAFDLRRHLLPLMAAAAVLVVVALAVGIPKLTRSDGVPAPVTSANPSPTSTMTIPGFTDAQLKTVRDACVAGAKAEKKTPRDFGRKQAKDVVDLDSLSLLNAVRNDDSTTVMLGNGTQLATCSWHAVNRKSSLPPVARLSHIGFDKYAQWLPGPVSVDATGGSEIRGKTYMQIIGRVPAGVTAVEVTVNEGTDKESRAKAQVVDGTWATTVTFEIYNEGYPIPTVRTFDANGKKLGERGGRNSDCFADPDGNVIYGGPRQDASTCKEATPWR